MNHLLLILTGGTGIPLLVFLIARRLVEGHAERTAAAIRAQHDEPTPAQAPRRPTTTSRPKELAR